MTSLSFHTVFLICSYKFWGDLMSSRVTYFIVHCGNGERVKEELTRYISQEWLGELKFSSNPVLTIVQRQGSDLCIAEAHSSRNFIKWF